jgi:hypothetical protein
MESALEIALIVDSVPRAECERLVVGRAQYGRPVTADCTIHIKMPRSAHLFASGSMSKLDMTDSLVVEDCDGVRRRPGAAIGVPYWNRADQHEADIRYHALTH